MFLQFYPKHSKYEIFGYVGVVGGVSGVNVGIYLYNPYMA